jgi:hypothetical protein
MSVPTPKFHALLSSLAVAAALAACDSSTTGPAEPSALRPPAAATSAHDEFEIDVNFEVYSVCLDAWVILQGTALWSVHTVTKPDGSRHINLKMDVSGPTITSGGSVWTANPGASEMFVRNIPAGGTIGADDRQTEHQGTVIYRSADGRPDLRFVHRIHLVRLPGSDEVQLNHSIFEIVCVAPKN